MTDRINLTQHLNLPQVDNENRFKTNTTRTVHPDKSFRDVDTWRRYIAMQAGKLHHTADEYRELNKQITG